jgi:hypothetical protein
MLKISIPQPCHQDWNEMNPNEQGRHCSSCAKTVVDFTNMSDDEVKNFFLAKKDERVCGRFKQQQLQQVVIDLPHNIFSIQMPVWKRFLVASLIIFSTSLFSCNTSIDGKLVKNDDLSNLIENAVENLRDRSDITVGMTFTHLDTIPQPKTCTYIVGNLVPPPVIKEAEPELLMGDVNIEPADTSRQRKCEPMLIREILKEGPLMGVPVLMITKPTYSDTIARPTKNPPKADSSDCNKKTYY